MNLKITNMQDHLFKIDICLCYSEIFIRFPDINILDQSHLANITQDPKITNVNIWQKQTVD